jgi:23S rRNA pseudouridine2605 synthase
MEIRLQKALAQAGVASRRRAEQMIVAGEIEVNGAIVRELGTKVDPERDLIRVRGKLLASPEHKVYFVLHKPAGMVTTFHDPQGRPTIQQCLEGIEERVFAVGRLDWDAEGALIITNDGELTHRLMHPRFEVPRTYLAKVKGEPDTATLEKLRSGVQLEDGMVHPTEVEVRERTEKNTWLRIGVAEGRTHLIKRLCAAVGHPVVRLFRAQYAGIGVDGLAPGRWRPLTQEEVQRLTRAGPLSASPAPLLRLPPRHHRPSQEPRSTPSVSRHPSPRRKGPSRRRSRR